MKVGDVVKASWQDHAFHADWPVDTRLVDWETVGYLVDDDGVTVCVAASRQADGTYADVTVIDRRMLRSVRKV